jgi:hypothetical protein
MDDRPMDDRPVVAVLGAAGAVGAPAARALGRLGAIRLRAGLRGDSLEQLCNGCDLVINCIDPGAVPRNVVASAAFAAGADYLDPGGGGYALIELAGLCPPGARLVLGAGVQPGLSELVPRWLASHEPPHPLTLTAYLATLDRMTPGSAAELLLSLAGPDGGTRALWRAGARLPGRLDPAVDASVPFFPAPVSAYPYLSAETERLGRLLPLDEIRWYNVFDSTGSMPAVLARLGALVKVTGDPALLAGDLIAAVAAELSGRQPLQQLVCELTSRDASRVAVLRATSTYELTATVTALAAMRMLDGSVPLGAHLAGEILPPQTVAELAGRPGLAGLHVLDQSLADCAESDEGTI